MQTIGVILAGGMGLRFGGSTPKQYMKLAGKMIIEYTIDAFEKSDTIDKIVIVCHPDFSDKIWETVSINSWKKVDKVIVGGKDRMDSTWSAIKALAALSRDAKIIFHDAVRPFVTSEIIAACSTALDTFPAVDVVIPSADTLVQIQDNGCIANIPDRRTMRRGQTPQAFRLGVIQQAYEKALKTGRRDFTCDCGVVRAVMPQTDVATVDGAEGNIKITTPMDLFLAEKLMQSRASVLTEEADLADLSGKRIVIFGGSSGIGKAIRELALVNNAQAIVASRSANGIDVSDFDAVSRFLADITSDGRKIDIVINTAGILVKRPFSQMAPREINEVIATNYHGAINVASAAHEFLRETKGVLLNFTSSSYTRGRAFYAVYSSTKSAIVNLTQALAEEWHDHGVRVLCINPERTKTPMRTSNFGQEDPLSLLDPKTVAHSTLRAALSEQTGMIVDVRRSALDPLG